MKRTKYVVADTASSAWKLPPNNVWNVPDGVDEVRGSLKTTCMCRIPVSYRALAAGFHGYVYGTRTLSALRESGYCLEGSVQIAGRRYRGFTSSQLFERPDGSLVDVATIHVCAESPLPRRVQCVKYVFDLWGAPEYRNITQSGVAMLSYTFESKYKDSHAFIAEVTCGEPF
jgi:hypothetical protein